MFTILSVFVGSRVNDTRQASLGLLSSQLLKSRYNLLLKGICLSYHPNEQVISKETFDEIQANDCIQSSIDGATALFKSNPYCVLKVPAQLSLLSAIFTGAVTFYSTVLGFLIKPKTQAPMDDQIQ